MTGHVLFNIRIIGNVIIAMFISWKKKLILASLAITGKTSFYWVVGGGGGKFLVILSTIRAL